jgi:hypothetical protein
MSLKRALEEMPLDRGLEAAAREILALFVRNPADWLTGSDVRGRLHEPSDAPTVLGLLVRNSVLDFEDRPARYRLVDDAFLRIEVERFLRRVERYDQRAQANVARFRQRYHCS